MELYLDRIFDKNDLTNKTIKYYNRFFLDAQSSFEEIFGLSYKLFYGNKNNLYILYKLLDKYYRNEFFVKHFFIDKVLSKTEDIYFSELPVNNSRADIVSINKHSTVYEIKTEYDNLDRLKKQMDDYSLCFDYLYLVCHEKKLEDAINIIPETIGIYCYESHGNRLKLVRRAKLNRNIDSRTQLKMFTAKELESEFKTRDINFILNKYSKNKINEAFKNASMIKHADSCLKIKNECSALMNIH